MTAPSSTAPASSPAAGAGRRHARAALGVVEARAIAPDAHHGLLHDVPKLADATVHVSPANSRGKDHHAALAHVRT